MSDRRLNLVVSLAFVFLTAGLDAAAQQARRTAPLIGVLWPFLRFFRPTLPSIFPAWTSAPGLSPRRAAGKGSGPCQFPAPTQGGGAFRAGLPGSRLPE
jgi:hypothetical protein